MVVTTLQTLVLIVATLGGLALIGYPVKLFLERLRSPICVPTMVIGLAILQVVAWYWFEHGHRGLARPTIVLLGIGALFVIIDVAHRRGKILHVDQRAVRRAVASLSIGFIVVAINWSTVLSLPLLTTADTGNNDAVSYAVAAQSLVTGGFDQPGPVAGYHLGALARIDAFGSSALIAGVSDVSRLGAWRVSTGTLLALVILVTYTLAIFVDTLLGGDRWLLASVTAGAASCTILFVYVQVLFFVGQIMAMAVVPLLAVAAIRFRDAERRRELVGPLVSATAVCLIMLSHYAHMLVFGAPLFVLPVVLDRRDGEDAPTLVRRALRTGLMTVASVVLALIIVPAWVQHSIDYIRSKQDVIAGFALPGFTPPEILGFMRQVLPKPSIARAVWAVASVVVIAVCAIVTRRSDRRLVRYFTIFTILVLVSYEAIYRREGSGPSYRQWKWITFFEPTLVVLAIAIAGLALECLVATRAAQRRGVAVVMAVGFAIVASANTGSGRGTALRDRRQFAYATPDHFGLSTDPVLKGLDALNVNVTPFWDTMWSVYFLPDKTLYLQQASYYTITPPRADWTLVQHDGEMHGTSVHDVNSLFRLLHDDPTAPLSVEADALDGALSVFVDPGSLTSGQLKGSVSATNTGRARWLAKGVPGDVAVSVHLQDENGLMVNYGWARIELIPDRTYDLPPDSTTDQSFTLPTLSPGHYRLAFELMSDGIAWFGVPSVEDVVVP